MLKNKTSATPAVTGFVLMLCTVMILIEQNAVTVTALLVSVALTIFRLQIITLAYETEVRKRDFTTKLDLIQLGTDLEIVRLQLKARNDEIRRLRAMQVQGPAIQPDMLDRLIRLAHPDKHGNSETSNEVTKWLLSRRGKA